METGRRVSLTDDHRSSHKAQRATYEEAAVRYWFSFWMLARIRFNATGSKRAGSNSRLAGAATHEARTPATDCRQLKRFSTLQ
jgi:hypothetical protein